MGNTGNYDQKVNIVTTFQRKTFVNTVKHST